MFETLETAPPDAILGLTDAYRKDPNPHKINLSVGVYKDASGATPVLAAVKAAERRMLDDGHSKSYLGIDGLAAYNAAAQRLMFGADHEIVTSGRAATLQTPGGTGALRVAADFLKRKFPQARIWCSKPTWGNHHAVFQAADRQVETYAYLDGDGTGLDFAAMMQALAQIPAGDVVLLHGCCHNPTGIDPTHDQWHEIADLLHQRQLLPLVDLAYQGFGDGLVDDVAGLHEVCRPGLDVIICSSCSKNFGLYNERVGALTLVAGSAAAAQAALSHAKIAVRTNYSNPPRHGGAIVATVLDDPELRQQWEQELAGMRQRIHDMRRLFVESMAKTAPDRDFSFIARQRGMFSFSRLTPLQVDQLRSEFSIYVVSAGGRINVAGITPDNVGHLCESIAAVL